MLHIKAQKYGFYPIFLLFLQVGTNIKNDHTIKRTLKIFWLTFVAVTALLFAGILAIQLPQVQTYVAGKVVDRLDDKLDGDIHFEKIHLKPFTTLVLKKVAIIDRNPQKCAADPLAEPVDTFFRADYIIARFTLQGLFRNDCLHLDKAYINGAQMNLVIEDKEDCGDGHTQTDNLSRIFRLKKKTEPKLSEKEIFHINDVQIIDMGFALKDYGTDQTPFHGGINWNDLSIKDIDLTARNLQFKNSIMSGELKSMSFREKSGYRCTSLTGKARVGRGKTIIEDLHLTDPWSDVNLPSFMMSYANVKAFSNFISEVELYGDFRDTRLDFRTIAYFAPQLEGNRLNLRLDGNVSGHVDDFSISGLRFASQGGGFSGTLDGSMKGIPEIEDTRIEARISKSLVTTAGLGDFLSQWMKEGGLDFSRFAKGILFSLEAKAEGLLDNMDIDASVSSLAGGMKADVKLGNVISKDKPISISGDLSTDNLNIGRIIGSDMAGELTMETALDATLSENPSLNISGMKVSRLHMNGYDYEGIMATGNLNDNMFNGWITCHDPNLNFMLTGAVSLAPKGKDALYGFKMTIGDADLNALNIDKRGKSKVNLTADVNFFKKADGTLSGKIDIDDIMLVNKLGQHDIGNIDLNFLNKGESHEISFKSGFADGKFKGSSPIQKFIKDMVNVSFKRELPAMFKDPEYVWDGDSYDLRFDFKNSVNLMNFVMPGMYIDENTSIRANVSSDGDMDASLKSKRIALVGQFVKNIDLSLSNSGNELKGEVTCDSLQISSISLVNDRLELLAHDDHIGARYSYDNESEPVNKGEIVVTGNVSRDEDGVGMALDISPSALYVNSREWNILESRMMFKGKDISIDGFEMTSGDQLLRISGRTSAERKDTLALDLERFDISVLNAFLGDDFGVRGAATGNVRLLSPIGGNSLSGKILCDSTFIAGEALGELDLSGVWNEEFERYDLKISNAHDGHSDIDVTGKFSPSSKMLEAVASLNHMHVAYAEPFLKSIFSELGGSVSGDIILSGPLDDLTISSEGARLENALMKIAYTNVPYYADGAFHINDEGVFFDDISIRDSQNGTGTVTGSIGWDKFRDIRFNTKIKVNEIEGINVTEEMADAFYGNIFATGNVSITGPINSIVLSVDAVTAKQGQLHIPVSGLGASSGRTNLLKFKEPEKEIFIDPYMAMMKRIEINEAQESDFRVNLRVNASQDVEAFVEIDKATGNVLSGRGNGLVELEIGDDLFNINGEYTLTGGNYRFAALGLVSKDFQIQQDSKITFGGDIMESTLDITAEYATKASLGTLLADSTSVGNRRDVICELKITDKLKNPRLAFNIEIPDLDPMIKSRVESALSTEDKLQKQFLSLLVTNNFLPEEQSGIVNNSSALVTEAIANQLNNIFEKLDIPLDLGLKYQSNDRGTDIFDVAVSTQLFNNRVVVNGNIGNKQTGTSAQTDVVGDLDIEIKIDRSGSLRLNIFSHSADQYTNYLDNSQRNGVGLTYQTEFNNFGQFVRNIFRSKAKRQEVRQAEEEALLNAERVEIRITKDNDGKQER